MLYNKEPTPKHPATTNELINTLGVLGDPSERDADKQDARDFFGYEAYPITNSEQETVGFLLVVEAGGSVEPVILEKDKVISFKTGSGSGKIWVTYPDQKELEIHTDVNNEADPVIVIQHSITGLKNTGDTTWELVALFTPQFQSGDEEVLSKTPETEVSNSFLLHYSDDSHIKEQLGSL